MKIRNLESKSNSQILDIKSKELEFKVDEVKRTCILKLNELQNNFMKMIQNYKNNSDGLDKFFEDKSKIFDALDNIKADIKDFKAESEKEIDKRKTIFSLEPDSSLLINTLFDKRKQYLDELSEKKIEEEFSSGKIEENKLLINAEDYYGILNAEYLDSNSRYDISKLNSEKTEEKVYKEILPISSENEYSSKIVINKKSNDKTLNLNLKGLKLIEEYPHKKRVSDDSIIEDSGEISIEKFQNPIYDNRELKEPTKGTFDYSISNNSLGLNSLNWKLQSKNS